MNDLNLTGIRNISPPPNQHQQSFSLSSQKTRKERILLRPWLENLIESGLVPGLEWIDVEKTTFKVPWKHRSKKNWSLQHSSVFLEWAKNTGRWSEGDIEPDYAQLKTRLRCAFSKAPDIEELKDLHRTKNDEPYKVYRFKPRRAVRPGASFSRRTTVPITLKYRHKYRRPRLQFRSKYYYPQRHLADGVVKMEVDQVSSTSHFTCRESKPTDVIGHVFDGTGYGNDVWNTERSVKEDYFRQSEPKRAVTVGWNSTRRHREDETYEDQIQHDQILNTAVNSKRKYEEELTRMLHDQTLNITGYSKRRYEGEPTQISLEHALHIAGNSKRKHQEEQRKTQYERALNIAEHSKKTYEEDVRQNSQQHGYLNIGWNTQRTHQEIQHHEERVPRVTASAVGMTYHKKTAPVQQFGGHFRRTSMNEQEYNRFVNPQQRLSRDHLPDQSLPSAKNTELDLPRLSCERVVAHTASQMDVGLALKNSTGLYHVTHIDQSAITERHFELLPSGLPVKSNNMETVTFDGREFHTEHVVALTNQARQITAAVATATGIDDDDAMDLTCKKNNAEQKNEKEDIERFPKNIEHERRPTLDVDKDYKERVKPQTDIEQLYQDSSKAYVEHGERLILEADIERKERLILEADIEHKERLIETKSVVLMKKEQELIELEKLLEARLKAIHCFESQHLKTQSRASRDITSRDHESCDRGARDQSIPIVEHGTGIDLTCVDPCMRKSSMNGLPPGHDHRSSSLADDACQSTARENTCIDYEDMTSRNSVLNFCSDVTWRRQLSHLERLQHMHNKNEQKLSGNTQESLGSNNCLAHNYQPVNSRKMNSDLTHQLAPSTASSDIFSSVPHHSNVIQHMPPLTSRDLPILQLGHCHVTSPSQLARSRHNNDEIRADIRDPMTSSSAIGQVKQWNFPLDVNWNPSDSSAYLVRRRDRPRRSKNRDKSSSQDVVRTDSGFSDNSIVDHRDEMGMMSVLSQDQTEAIDDRLQTQIHRPNDNIYYQEGATIRQHLLNGPRHSLASGTLLQSSPMTVYSRDNQPPIMIHSRDNQQPMMVYQRDYQPLPQITVHSRDSRPPITVYTHDNQSPIIFHSRDKQPPITVYPRDYQRSYISNSMTSATVANSRNILPPLSPLTSSSRGLTPVVNFENNYQGTYPDKWNTQRPIKTLVDPLARHVMGRDVCGETVILQSRDSARVSTPRDSLNFKMQRPAKIGSGEMRACPPALYGL